MAFLMHGQTLTAEQRLERATSSIISVDRYRWAAGLLMYGKRTVENDIPTAQTDGVNEKYGREFITGLTDPELRFLVLHEMYHKLYKHLITWKHLYEEDADTANKACDYVINGKLIKENAVDKFAVMPKSGLHDPQYDGMDSGMVYRLLRQQAQQQSQQSGQPQPQPQPLPGQGQPQPGQGQGQGQPQPGQPGTGFDAHDWESAQAMTEEESNEIGRKVDELVRQGVLAASKLGCGTDRDIVDLLTPKVDWREVLRDFLNENFAGDDLSTWSRPERRYISMGAYLPSSYSETMGELVIAIDTSGSIGNEELGKFLGEVASICETIKPKCVRVLYWDTKVRKDEKYEDEEVSNLVRSTKAAGGGGTNVECVPKYMGEFGIAPQAVVVLTDGFLGGSWGQWTCPVLWGIVDNKNARPTVGKYVHISN